MQYTDTIDNLHISLQAFKNFTVEKVKLSL
jgi:hypothetical protein